VSARPEIALRLLDILQSLDDRYADILASMKQEFAIGDLGTGSERRVSAALPAALLAWLHARTADRSLGLDLGLNSPISATGPLGVHLAACPDLLVAAGELQRYYPLLSWDESRLRVMPHSRGIVIELSGFSIASIADVLLRDIALGRVLKLARRLAGEQARPHLLIYPESGFGQPARIDTLARQVAYGRDRLSLLFAESDVRQRARHANPWLMQVLKPELEQELELLARASSLSSQIQSYLAGLDTLAEVSQVALAQRFHLSESSLKRRLAEENTSFSELLQGFRRDRSLELLTDTDDKLEGIAAQLGFSERASFERAFRQWFDMTPASYREQIRRLGGDEAGVESLDLDKLPSSPRVCMQILELLEQEDFHLDELVSLVGMDPLLSAKLMGIARSAYYGGRAVQTLGDAIAKVLGVDQVRYMALLSAANAQFSANLPQGFDLRGFWLTSLLSAFFVSAIHRLCPTRFTAQPVELYLAALLLDIGAFMLAHMYPARMEQFLARSASLEDPRQRHELESAILGTSTRAAGALLLAHWNLPKTSIRIVRELDGGDSAGGLSPEALLIAATATFAREYYPAAQDSGSRDRFIDTVTTITGMPAQAIEQLVRDQDTRIGDFEALLAQLLF
jgi:HD-like signal output (HDOD) protein/AraC-like DNA-binding protein